MHKKILSLIAFLAIAGTATAQSVGTVVTETLRSTVLADNKVGLDLNRLVKIYLPPSYATTKKNFPVVYFCHNFFQGPEQMDSRAIPLLNRAMGNGTCGEFIMVVASYRGPGIGSLYENSTTSGRWLDYTIQEVVPFIDQKFRTIKNRDSRAVIGDFMGGRGALKLAMSYPTVFGTVYAMHPVATGSGSLPWAVLNIDWEKISNAKTLEDLKGPDRSAIFVAIHQAFLPNPKRPPFYCDFSVEFENGERKLKPENMMKTKKGFHLDESLPESADNLRQLRGIGMDWGRYDENNAHVESAREFSSKLEDLGITHTAEEYNGTPFNKVWTDDGRFYTRVLPFLNQHLVFSK